MWMGGCVWILVVLVWMVVSGLEDADDTHTLIHTRETNIYGSTPGVHGSNINADTPRHTNQHLTDQSNQLPGEIQQDRTEPADQNHDDNASGRGGNAGGRQQSGYGIHRRWQGSGRGGGRASRRGRRVNQGVPASSNGSSGNDILNRSPEELAAGAENSNQHLVLMLQRMSDRLTGIEVLQRQQTERIGTINYRLTKMELEAEERKSVTNDLSNSVRHLIETTNSEFDQINSHFDGMKTNLMNIDTQHTIVKTMIQEVIKAQEGSRGSGISGMMLHGMIGTLHGLTKITNMNAENIKQFSHNLTSLTAMTTNLSRVSERMVTKQYLYDNLNELRGLNSAVSHLAWMTPTQQTSSPATNRRGHREPEDCWQILRKGTRRSGVYSIQPRYSPTPFFVYCDMETDGGGWTVIQRREDGSVDFLREWSDYKHGFGNIAGDYWLGNEKIHLLTNQQVSMLRVDLADYDQQVSHALYSAFAVGSELEGYSLKMLGQYSGDAGDSLHYHVGRRFSTIDVDNDAWPERSCARDHMGAWWYRACETSNLNGRYLHGPIPAEHQYTGVYWYDFRGPQYSLWRSRMMVRRGGKVDQPVVKNSTDVRPPTHTQRETTFYQEEKEEEEEDEEEEEEEEEGDNDEQVSFDPNKYPYVTFDYHDV